MAFSLRVFALAVALLVLIASGCGVPNTQPGPTGGRQELQGANLSGAYLDGANLMGANLDGANLSGAHLQSANLSGARLQSANLQRANLDHTDLTGVRCDSRTVWPAFFEAPACAP